MLQTGFALSVCVVSDVMLFALGSPVTSVISSGPSSEGAYGRFWAFDGGDGEDMLEAAHGKSRIPARSSRATRLENRYEPTS